MQTLTVLTLSPIMMRSFTCLVRMPTRVCTHFAQSSDPIPNQQEPPLHRPPRHVLIAYPYLNCLHVPPPPVSCTRSARCPAHLHRRHSHLHRPPSVLPTPVPPMCFAHACTAHVQHPHLYSSCASSTPYSHTHD